MSNDVFAGFNRGPTDPNTLTMSSFDSDSDSSSDRPKRMNKFGKALQAAAAYKKKRQAENEADAEVGKNGKDDDVVGPKGFKIGSDSTVVTGYRDPGFTLKGVKGSSPLGPIGAAVGIFNPAVGAGISAVGDYISS